MAEQNNVQTWLSTAPILAITTVSFFSIVLIVINWIFPDLLSL